MNLNVGAIAQKDCYTLSDNKNISDAKNVNDLIFNDEKLPKGIEPKVLNDGFSTLT